MNETWSCSGILFDLDGVLVDSIAAVERQWRFFAQRHKLDPEHVLHIAHGNRSIDSVRLLLPEADAVAESAVVEKGEIEDTNGLRAKEAAAALLASLPPELWAIVTSGTRKLATSRLKAVGLPVPKNLISANEVTRGKPDPEPYLKGAALLGFAPAQCLVFEDAPSGVKAGKAAGARVIGVKGTYSKSELSAADSCISSLAEVEIEVNSRDAGGGRLRVKVASQRD